MSLARQLIGETTMAGDVPSVLGNAPATTALQNGDSSEKRNKRRKEDSKKKKRLHNAVVDGIIGHGIKENLFPEDAKVVDTQDASNNALSLDDYEEPSSEVSDPYKGDVEPLIDPTVALVAPDVTPNALKPVDPSSVPGASQGAPPEEKVSEPEAAPEPMPTEPPAAPASAAPEAAPATTEPAPAPTSPPRNAAMSAMDTILGRRRAAESAPQPAQAPITESAALSHLPGIAPAPGPAASINPMATGTGMPDPHQGDGKKILEAARRFCK